MKRVLLFVLTNVAVMVVLSAVVYLLGLDKYLSGRGGMGGTRAGGVQRIARGWRGLARRAHARQAAHPPGRAHPGSGGSPLKALTGAPS